MPHCRLNRYPSISNTSVPRKPLKQLSAGLLTYSSFRTPSQETLCSKWYFNRLTKLFGAYSSGYCLGFAPSSLFTNRPKDRVMAPLTSYILCKCNQKISNCPKYQRASVAASASAFAAASASAFAFSSSAFFSARAASRALFTSRSASSAFLAASRLAASSLLLI